MDRNTDAIPELDAHDRAILALLQRDGRMPNAQLAESVGLSPSACLRRVQRLEHNGVISRYVALLEPARIGRATTVFVEVTLDSQREEALAAFEKAAAACGDVLECHLMAGDFDYLLRVAPNGPQGYERLHKQELSRLPHVVRIRSSFALRTVVRRTDYAV
jgi:DNA-binding Lrp family transcriptional regulator